MNHIKSEDTIDRKHAQFSGRWLPPVRAYSFAFMNENFGSHQYKNVFGHTSETQGD